MTPLMRVKRATSSVAQWLAESPYRTVATTLGAAHLLLLAHDLRSIDGFFRADRATQRFHAMRAVIGASQGQAPFGSTLAQQGNIGDYGLHALFYALGGPLAIVAWQSVLGVLAAVCVAYIAATAFGSRRIAAAAGLLYGLLPQSLAFPHQLLSEAISNPFLIFGTAGVLWAMQRRARGPAWLLAGLSMGIAGLVRPALILLPPLAAALVLGLDRAVGRRLHASTLLAAGFAPFVLWGLFMLAQTGKFGLGESHQDLGLNFSQSTAKVLLEEGMAPRDGTPPPWLPERLGVAQYLHYVAAYPRGFANLYAKNLLVMSTDSGIGRLYVDLLGFGADERLALQDPVTGWRAQLTNHGVLTMLTHEWDIAPGTILAGVVGALAFALVNVGVVAAYVVLCRHDSALRDVRAPAPQRWCLAFIALVPVYVLVTSQVVAYAPSRLRSQGEFALALLACFGWAAMHRARRRTDRS